MSTTTKTEDDLSSGAGRKREIVEGSRSSYEEEFRREERERQEKAEKNDMIRRFYNHLFPYKLVYSWLNYKDKSGQDTFFRREFAFNLDDDTIIRHESFPTDTEFAKYANKFKYDKYMHRMEIGPIYNIPPVNKNRSTGAFTAQERELVFDIDMDDYDDVRICCSGAAVCRNCWSFITMAVKILDETLRRDFGFKHIMFVYSGRRGMHCWVSDPSARRLQNEERSAIVEYMNIRSGDGAGLLRQLELKPGKQATETTLSDFASIMDAITEPLHPSLERSYGILEKLFEKHIIDVPGQGLLTSPRNWEQLLELIPPAFKDERKNIKERWEGQRVTARDRWVIFKEELNNLKQNPKKSNKLTPAHKTYLNKIKYAVVFLYTYPRLDINVTKQVNHLLKSPFCIHPGTMKVCVPFLAENSDDFDPDTVPKAQDLWNPSFAKADDTSSAVAKGQLTALKPYLETFGKYIIRLNEDISKASRSEQQGIQFDRDTGLINI